VGHGWKYENGVRCGRGQLLGGPLGGKGVLHGAWFRGSPPAGLASRLAASLHPFHHILSPSIRLLLGLVLHWRCRRWWPAATSRWSRLWPLMAGGKGSMSTQTPRQER
jgi:hypothetical protein